MKQPTKGRFEIGDKVKMRYEDWGVGIIQKRDWMTPEYYYRYEVAFGDGTYGSIADHELEKVDEE